MRRPSHRRRKAHEASIEVVYLHALPTPLNWTPNGVSLLTTSGSRRHFPGVQIDTRQNGPSEHLPVAGTHITTLARTSVDLAARRHPGVPGDAPAGGEQVHRRGATEEEMRLILDRCAGQPG